MTGANAPKRAVVGDSSGSVIVTAHSARGKISARGSERAHKVVTVMPALMVLLLMPLSKV